MFVNRMNGLGAALQHEHLASQASLPAFQEELTLRYEHCKPSDTFLSRVPGCFQTWSLVLIEKQKATPKSQDPAWHSQWGHGVLLLNIALSIEHHHQTRPLCDQDGSRQKQAPTLEGLSDAPPPRVLRPGSSPWRVFSSTAMSNKPN